ncbi:hypothetical protein GCM10009780_53350 [Actinomadura alba]
MAGVATAMGWMASVCGKAAALLANGGFALFTTGLRLPPASPHRKPPEHDHFTAISTRRALGWYGSCKSALQASLSPQFLTT